MTEYALLSLDGRTLLGVVTTSKSQAQLQGEIPERLVRELDWVPLSVCKTYQHWEDRP